MIASIIKLAHDIKQERVRVEVQRLCVSRLGEDEAKQMLGKITTHSDQHLVVEEELGQQTEVLTVLLDHKYIDSVMRCQNVRAAGQLKTPIQSHRMNRRCLEWEMAAIQRGTHAVFPAVNLEERNGCIAINLFAWWMSQTALALPSSEPNQSARLVYQQAGGSGGVWTGGHGERGWCCDTMCRLKVETEGAHVRQKSQR
jgi:hypothetical protein